MQPFARPHPPRQHGSEQQMLLLEAALLQGEAACAAWRAWRLTADLDQLPLGGFGLLPLLAYNLQQQGVADPLLDKCHGIRRRTWTQHQLYIRQVATLVQALQAAGVSPLLQNELVLALAYYPASGVRLIQRVQLITPAPQAPIVRAQLAQSQWCAVQTPKARLRAFIGGPQPQRFRQPESDLVLEWQNASPTTCPPFAHLWQHRQPLPLNGIEVQCVSATDLFFSVCGQGIADFWRFGAIQWLADAVMLLRTAPLAIDWARLLEQSTQQAATLRMTAALQGLHTWVEAPIPPDVLSAVATLPIQPFERWEAQAYHRLPPLVSKGVTLWLAGHRQRWCAGKGLSLSTTSFE